MAEARQFASGSLAKIISVFTHRRPKPAVPMRPLSGSPTEGNEASGSAIPAIHLAQERLVAWIALKIL